MDRKVVNFPDWTAFFTNVPVSNGQQVPLTATGNHGGSMTVEITVSNPPPGAPGTGTDVCIQVDSTDTTDVCNQVEPTNTFRQAAPVPGWRYTMIQHLRVKRRNPIRPGGYALRLEFRGTSKASFIVGGMLATPGDHVEMCSAGPHQAVRILNKEREWQAVLEDVLPGAHVLRVKTKAGVADQVPILIEAKE
jgi:hypothetical protein